MLVLGWHGSWFRDVAAPGFPAQTGYCHDSSAAIFQDGTLVAAIEEERLDRIKHSRVFPTEAIRFCLEQVGAKISDVDVIATDFSQLYLDGWAEQQIILDPDFRFPSAKENIAAAFSQEFGADVSNKLFFVRHHLAHLYSACFCSGFDECLAICIDNGGEGSSGAVAQFRDEQIDVLRFFPDIHSLGAFYDRSIAVLGYTFGDEYKVMGLAPYGDPERFRKLFEGMYQLMPEGRFAVAPDVERLTAIKRGGILIPDRRKNEPFTQQHKDFAAGLQCALEKLVTHIVTHFRRSTGIKKLSLSGGVSHNCSMNGKLLRSGLFDAVYVQPACHDAGNAIGAAIAAMKADKKTISRHSMPHVFLGTDIGTSADVERHLAQWGDFLTYTKLSNPAAEAAQLIAAGKVIGWVQGRSEFGPRALGNRSILADPRPKAHMELINSMVKKREGYRPFAPSVISDRLADFFELPEGSCGDLSYMTIVIPVRRDKRQQLGAVTHIDGSARVQSVSRENNAMYHSLIKEFERLTGVPVVLNTSFNNNAEPIVDLVHDAITCFLTTNIDKLIVGDWLIQKRCDIANNLAVISLIPTLSKYRRLVRHSQPKEEAFIESFRAKERTKISPDLFDLLANNRSGSAQRSLEDITSDPTRREDLGKEMLPLWEKRLITLRPPRIYPSAPVAPFDDMLDENSRSSVLT